MWAKRDFYQSKEWRQLREWALSKYGPVCMKCSSTQDIQVDHVLPRSRYPRLKLSKHNVGILCKPCNQSKAAKIEPDYRPIGTRMKDKVRKFMQEIIILIVISVVARFLSIDLHRAPWEFTITCQIYNEVLTLALQLSDVLRLSVL